MDQLINKLKNIKIIPVITINNSNHAVPLAKTLVDNGLPCAEITFRTSAAIEAIQKMRGEFPTLLIGAGTILTIDQVEQAMNAGADFIVSPGFNPKIVSYCQNNNIPIIPGINSPSLVEQALELNLSVVKFFPAEPSGGIAMLKALSTVYPIQFMPTGGITMSNIEQYLELPSIIACGGSWMVPSNLIEQEDWTALGKLVYDAANL
ncbi:MAG: bifunctional 4-hydroxy-2-oxoglutarate aldolase/2-dehydro-3-deoxy-phosphogluconate aldolase [Providencia sp.]|nr:bifunctional 4-hydroxy-2-oxoglutarate aldolase/2-dehydro-3-deoxy-phosphogluconate aldolase [Providencia sp.]